MVTLLSHMAFPGFSVQFGATLFHKPMCVSGQETLTPWLPSNRMDGLRDTESYKRTKGKASMDIKFTSFQPHRARAQSAFRDPKGFEGSVGVPTARDKVTEAEP